MTSTRKFGVFLLLVIFSLLLSIDLSSAQLSNVNKFFSNLGHGIKSVFTGRPVTLSGSSGPYIPPGQASKDTRDVRYFLYPDKTNSSYFIELNLDTVKDDIPFYLSPTKQIKILIHGFNKNSTGKRFPVAVKNVYLNYTDHHILVVDWGKLSTPANVGKWQVALYYPNIAKKVDMVGDQVGKCIVHMLDAGIIKDFNQVHIIGFSLGAHVAGFAGAYVLNKTGKQIGRITGLDPAKPMFSNVGNDKRLDRTDANFVDVVHSSRFGLSEDIADVDFYPNGGKYQQNCIKENTGETSAVSSFYNYINSYSASASKCGHYRASQYFAHSIRQGADDKVIFACKSKSWDEYLLNYRDDCDEEIPFGEYCPPTARGKYFLEINI